MAQRIMQYQAALQLAAQAPNLYDLPLLHRQMMELIGISNADKIVPQPDDVPPKDPVTENQDILTQAPVKVYQYQDHEAHMRVHIALKNDPQIGQEMQNSPAGAAINGALDSHVREHLAFIFRSQIEQELGVELPPIDEPLPEDVERRLSTLVADAADQMLGKKQAQQQAEQNAAMQQDPIVQQRERELGIREMEVQRKQQADAADQQTDAAKQQLEQEKLAVSQQQDVAKLALEREKMEGRQEIDIAELSLEEEELKLKAIENQQEFESSRELEGIKLGRDMAKDQDDE
jgi:hypothetical protein